MKTNYKENNMIENKNFDMGDYYIGIVTAKPEYLDCELRYDRKDDEGMPLDPFFGLSDNEALVTGQIVTLKKVNDEYIDIDHSCSDDVLAYKPGEANDYGISLNYMKPFKECYNTEAKVIDSDNLYDGNNRVRDINTFVNIISSEYYILYSKKNNDYSIEFNNVEPRKQVQREYACLLGLSNKEYTK